MAVLAVANAACAITAGWENLNLSRTEPRVPEERLVWRMRFDRPDGLTFVERHLRFLACSGVPYEFYLADDVIERPSLLDGVKTVVFMLWRKFDAKRIAAAKRLASPGRTLIYLVETGVLGGAEESTGFRVGYCDKKARTFETRAEPGYADPTVGSYELEYQRSWGRFSDDPENPIRIPSGRRTWIEETPGTKVLARYADDGQAAMAERSDGGCRRVYIAPPGGLTPETFNRLARESGAYVPVDRPWLQVNMNGDFVSVHALKGGKYDFRLPFPCRPVNVKSGRPEKTENGAMRLELTAGQTCWFLLERPGMPPDSHSRR